MQEFRINDKISYIQGSADPLSADIGIVRSNSGVWIYDVGDDPSVIVSKQITGNVVISHFHKDHTGNLQNVSYNNLYISSHTKKHTGCDGTVVSGELQFDDVRLFLLPSSHTKGCLCMEIDSEYAFVGDALYSIKKNNAYVFNAQLVKEEIEVLKSIKANKLLVSHLPGLVKDKAEAIKELEAIYSHREKNNSEIKIFVNLD